MIGQKEKNPQLNMFRVPLKQFIDEKHDLVGLAGKIDWKTAWRPIIARITDVQASPCA